MNWRICLLGIASALVMVSNSSWAQGSENDPNTLSRSINSFAIDLYGQLKAQPGNLFFSPFSIETALAMTYTGARGQTAQQMASAMHIAPSGEPLNVLMHALITQLSDGSVVNGHEMYALHNADGLWMKSGYAFNPDFEHILQRDYGAEARLADFNNAAGVTGEINGWVKQKTEGKITQLISPGAIDTYTAMVLVNAIYFKGVWQDQFNANSTMRQPFHTDAQHEIQVPMMRHVFDHAAYMENEQMQVLELPYRGDISMVIILPKGANGLSALEKEFTSEHLMDWFGKLRNERVNVSLPKFKIESGFGLVQPLKALGIHDAFDKGRADFSGMARQDQLYISEAIHKAYVDVNEQGTEAAAATGIVMTRGMATTFQKFFKADHPYLFLIRDTHSGTVLFLGRVMNPAS